GDVEDRVACTGKGRSKLRLVDRYEVNRVFPASSDVKERVGEAVALLLSIASEGPGTIDKLSGVELKPGRRISVKKILYGFAELIRRFSPALRLNRDAAQHKDRLFGIVQICTGATGLIQIEEVHDAASSRSVESELRRISIPCLGLDQP